MRAVWTGSIAFGLVNVPVKAYGAVSDHDVSLHQVHDKDGGRIRYQRRCEVCDEIVDYKNIDKAYDDGDHTVVLSDEELDALPSSQEKEIEVVQFVPSDQIDPIMLEKSYYLEPDSKSPKAYVLLRRTLEETDRTAIVKFALRQKTRLGILRVKDKVLVLQGMHWADEVREADFPSLEKQTRIGANELKMSASLVKEFSSDFTPEEFIDEYQEELNTLIEAKIEKGEKLDTEDTFGTKDSSDEDTGKVIDLMEALKRSIDAKKGGSKTAQKKSTTKKKSSSSKSGSSKSA